MTPSSRAWVVTEAKRFFTRCPASSICHNHPDTDVRSRNGSVLVTCCWKHSLDLRERLVDAERREAEGWLKLGWPDD